MKGLIDILSDSGEFTAEAITFIQNYAQKWNTSILRAVTETHLLPATRVADIIAQKVGLERMSRISPEAIGEDAFNSIDFPTAKAWDLMPLGRRTNSQYRVVMSDPTDDTILEPLKKLVTEPIEILVGESVEIHKALYQYYPVEQQLPTLSQLER